MPSMTPLLRHRAFLYDTVETFTESVLPFLREGAERGERAVAVTTAENLEALEAVFDDELQTYPAADWYTSPEETAWRFRSTVQDAVESGVPWVRLVGEPVWTGRDKAERASWMTFESLLNLSLSSSPCTLVCAYDTAALPRAVVDGAQRTHARIGVDEAAEPSPGYTPRALEARSVYSGSSTS